MFICALKTVRPPPGRASPQLPRRHSDDVGLPVLNTTKLPFLVASTALVATFAVVAALTRTDDSREHATPTRDGDAQLYAALVESDFEAVARRADLSFSEAHGATPSPESRPAVYAVFATFGAVPVRQRIAYQIGAAGSRVGRECVPDDLGWECFRRVDDVVVQGESYCLATRCETSRRDAAMLLKLAVRHLANIRAERDT